MDPCQFDFIVSTIGCVCLDGGLFVFSFFRMAVEHFPLPNGMFQYLSFKTENVVMTYDFHIPIPP